MPKRQRYTRGYAGVVQRPAHTLTRQLPVFVEIKLHRTGERPVLPVPPLRLSHCYLIAFQSRISQPEYFRCLHPAPSGSTFDSEGGKRV